MLVTWKDFVNLIKSYDTKPFRMGIVYPEGGCETDFYTFEKASAETVRLYFSNPRIDICLGDSIHSEYLQKPENIDWVLKAARRLTPFKLDSLVLACSYDSFIEGKEFALTQVQLIEEASKTPTTSTSLAFIAALKALSIKNVAVMTAYPEAAIRHFSVFLEEFEIEVIDVECLFPEGGWMSAEVSSKLIKQKVESMDKRAGALLIPDTALPSFAALKEIDSNSTRPVLSANLVSIWHGLHVGKYVPSMQGFGPLFDLNRNTFFMF